MRRAGPPRIFYDQLIADLRSHGGTLTAGNEVTEPPRGVVVFDTAPTVLLDVYGDTLPARYANALRRYRFGSGVAKVAESPMVLAALPHLVDPSRIDAAGRRPMWTYAHVPSGSPIDATEAVTAAIERFAPGFRDVVVATRSVPASRLADHNANYVGGDIGVDGNNAWRAIAGPTPRLNPWATPWPKVYLCSAATPPGAGVHGMAGYYAARTLLRREFGLVISAR